MAETSDGILISDGFDFPVGPRGANVDVFKTHKIDTVLADPAYFKNLGAWHPGEDWNGRGGGDTDLGDPVYAISNGRVAEFGDYPVWGNIVLLEHALPDGTRVWSQYAHLDKILVNQKGQNIQRGTQVGTIGKGANNRYVAHLHFEIRKNKLPIGNWFPMMRNRDEVLANYYNPTDFIQAHRPGKIQVPEAIPNQIIVGPQPGSHRAGSFQQGGGGWNSAPGGYGSNLFWVPASTNSETNWAEWRPALPAAGQWEIWVYLPQQNATTTYARYTITHARGQTEIPVNQAGYNNAWANLGVFQLAPNQAAVRLSNFTGEFGPPRMVGFDTVVWTRVG